MKNRNIEFGVFILTVGIILLLANIGIINWSIMGALFDLWPAIFIVIGVNIIFRNNSIVRIITWLIFMAAIVSYGYFFNGSSIMHGGQAAKNITIEKASETEQGELKLKLGGIKLNVDSTDTSLLDSAISNPDIKHKVEYSSGKKMASVQFERENLFIMGGSRSLNDCRFSLNDSILWDIDVDAGAVSGTIDLTNLLVKDLDVDMGAGSIKLVLGNKNKNTNVKIDAGASSFDVVLPKDAGVRIKLDGALNNTNLKNLGWNKQGNYYTSPNYNAAERKIDMDVGMGAGRFTVTTLQ